MAVPEKNLKVDRKKRITLGKFIPDEVTSVDVELKNDGTIVLHPKVEIPAEELWLFKNKDALNSVLRGVQQVQNGKVSNLEDGFWDV